MSYTLTIRKEPDYLYIEATGTRARDTIVRLAEDSIAACNNHGCGRLVLDVRKMTGRLATIEAYDLAKKDLTQLRQGIGIKVAILDLERNRGRFQFLENVAVNAGINLHVSSNLETALRWLLGPITSDTG